MKCPLVVAIGFVVLSVLLSVPRAVFAADTEETVQSAMEMLDEVMSSPGKGIPASMLKDAQGVAIIPGVVRVGVIAGVRRGKGVVVVREDDGSWALPQFVTLTGGNIGFQVGAESADVLLVFKTKRSVKNLMDGKFTIGGDAGAAAGPVGRRVEAATDVQLKSEIYSYSRSRGLFAGVSLDGSKMQLDQAAYRQYYGLDGKVPQHSAVQLVELLVGLVERGDQEAPKEIRGEVEILGRPEVRTDTRELRRQLAEASMRLQAKLDDTWSRYLALPAEIFEGSDPRAEALAQPMRNFALVAGDGRFNALAELTEFQRTHDLLRRYAAKLTPAAPKLALPPPPGP